jgi:hypothetical protein
MTETLRKAKHEGRKGERGSIIPLSPATKEETQVEQNMRIGGFRYTVYSHDQGRNPE